MARRVRDDGRLSTDDWREFVSLVEQHVSGLPAQFEEAMRQQEQEREQDETRRREREQKAPNRRSLADQVQEILQSPTLGCVDQMRELALLCFVRVLGLEDQTGGWTDLPEDLRRQVLDACRIGLERGEPTPIPTEGSYPGSILGEGVAFAQVVLAPDQAAWLTESMISRWLPTALFAPTSGDWAELVRTCWAVSEPATAQVLVNTIADQTRRNEQPHSLRCIPSECWTNAMTEQVVTLLLDDSIRPRAHRELLEQLVTRCPERSDGIAAAWAARPVVADVADQLRQPAATFY
jgi:hypothetical protein